MGQMLHVSHIVLEDFPVLDITSVNRLHLFQKPIERKVSTRYLGGGGDSTPGVRHFW